MKKIMLNASILLALVVSLPACAAVDHHQATKAEPAMEHHPGNPVAMEMTHPSGHHAAPEMGQMDTSLQQMQTMRGKIEMEKNPVLRKQMMREHVRMMREAMDMISMMNEGCMMMKEEHHATMPEQKKDAMPMHDGMKMMDQGGMMAMMDKKMALMKEIMNGILMQQEMMLD